MIDWEAGIADFLLRIFREKSVTISAADVLRAREDIEFEMIQARYRSYKEILAQSLREAFEKYSIPYSNRDGERLAESVPTWPVFEETRPALEKLATKHALVIISNIDNETIEKTKSRIGVSFGLTVTAQDAQAYKPSLRPFRRCLERLGQSPEQVLHVSSGYRYDIPPAHELGFKTAWINRKSEALPAGAVKPNYEFNSLTQLAELAGKL